MTKKRKKRRKLKIKNIMILLLILTTIGICIYYFVTMPIKNIYLKGNNIIPDNIIIEDSNINNYPSFLLTSNYEIEKRLKKNKYIEKVKVSKKIGNIIEIKITEYKPIAIIEKDNKIVLSSGEIVDNKYNIVDSPILTNTVDKNVYNEFINKFSKIENNILRQISQIEYNPTNVDKKRFLLYMNDSNMVYITLTKIEKINNIIK